ncbi:TerB family tellurite resistance protein [Pedobacter sp. UC225_61]|uniref:TerB family tellurite resistance protein n=1 Tax=Pedobacter sp. UC225_61 TaxID=3374623 RepID=UPI003798FD99
MKNIKKLFFGFAFLLCFEVSYAQSQEAKQLLLNVEKLSQLKNILADMKKGYTVVSNGYRSVKNIAQGNFSLHEVFLDGLMLVSPEVKKYARVADIISYQKDILSEYKRALKGFRAADVFSPNELSYLGSVYENLFSQSLQNLEDLAMVVTSSKLRMSDDERLRAIDRIFLDTKDKLMFLREFNLQGRMLMLQKQKEKREIEQLKSYYRQN